MPELLTAVVIIALIAVVVLIYIDQRHVKPKWDDHNELMNTVRNQHTHSQKGHDNGTRRY